DALTIYRDGLLSLTYPGRSSRHFADLSSLRVTKIFSPIILKSITSYVVDPLAFLVYCMHCSRGAVCGSWFCMAKGYLSCRSQPSPAYTISIHPKRCTQEHLHISH